MPGNDASAVLRGALRVAAEVRKQAEARARYKWAVSSVTAPLRTQSGAEQQSGSSSPSSSSQQSGPPFSPSEVSQRVGMVARGVASYVTARPAHTTTHPAPSSADSAHIASSISQEASPLENNTQNKSSQPDLRLNAVKESEEIVPTSENENNFWLPYVPPSFSQMKQSKKFAPIMDPRVAEVDLEKILGIGPRKYNNPLKGSAQNTNMLRTSGTLKESTISKRQRDTLEGIVSSDTPKINNIFLDTLAAAKAVKTETDTLKTTSHVSGTPSHVPDTRSHVSDTLTDMDTDAIEAEVHRLSLTAISRDLGATEATANLYPADVSASVAQALEAPQAASYLSGEASNTMKPHIEASNSVKPPAEASNTLKPPRLLGRKPLATKTPETLLGKSSHARKVPDTRFLRAASFGSLFVSLGAGTAAEVLRRGMGGVTKTGSLSDQSYVLTEANANRIVDALCKVRGAALKLGQMVSFADSSVISPQLAAIFERVRQSADHMPGRQLGKVLRQELGEEWRERFAGFDDLPFAAASIGQVHQGTLLDDRRVAVKVQYPGVFEGIESDIDNLRMVLDRVQLLPEQLYVDNIMEVAKRELAWECDYVRELECAERYKALLGPYPQYYVPATVPELSTRRVLTSELVEGIPVDRCVELNQETRNYVSTMVLELTLRETFQFGFMQTDPNWGNFLYNDSTKQLVLLDCGACREFDQEFLEKYIEIIHGAAIGDRQKVEKYSRDVGFLTGLEARVMIDAHVDSVMILGEAFRHGEAFSFADSSTSERVQARVPTMVAHRMCPPPEQVYSLHRKMSGVFLLCGRLQGRVDVSPLFFSLYDDFKAKQKAGQLVEAVAS